MPAYALSVYVCTHILLRAVSIWCIVVIISHIYTYREPDTSAIQPVSRRLYPAWLDRRWSKLGLATTLLTLGEIDMSLTTFPTPGEAVAVVNSS